MSFWKKIGVFLGGAATRMVGLQGGSPSRFTDSAATPVSADTALQVSSAWACCRIIAECIGSLPITLYDVDKNGVRTPNTTHPLAKLFAGKVNRWQTRNEFMESLAFQKVLMGNCYAVKQYNDKKELIALVPLMTEQMAVVLEESGAIRYDYTDGANMRVYAQDSIWHSKLFGNGIIGLSPLGYARNALGIAQGAEQATTKIYKNGGKPSGILTIDKVLTSDQRAAVKTNFSELAEGNQDRLFVLEAGMKYQQVSLSPVDIELLASRKFQTEDICRFFGVPSVLVNDMSAATAWGSGIETIIQGWYKIGLRPYLERFKSGMKCWLLTPAERLTMEIDFDLDALLEPAFSERMKSGKEAITGGVLTPNEVRKEEGLPPVSGGDKLYMQQQMMAIDDPNRGKPTGGSGNGQSNGQDKNQN